VGLPRFSGQVDRSHAMTLRLSIDDQPEQNQTDAYRVAMRRAESTGKRHLLIDYSGALLDLLNP